VELTCPHSIRADQVHNFCAACLPKVAHDGVTPFHMTGHCCLCGNTRLVATTLNPRELRLQLEDPPFVGRIQ
jgi:hypothetical protein